MSKKYTRQDVIDFIDEYCGNKPDDQRETLYDKLNKKFGLCLEMPDYNDKRIDHARFACDEQYEVDYVVDLVVDKLRSAGRLVE